MYQLGPQAYYDPRLQFLPFGPKTFDLVLLDGHPLRDSGKRYPQSKSDRLLISQLIIGLQSVAMSGTMVLKLASPEKKVTAQIMYLLDKLSLEFKTWKPVCMHATRDTFYAVAKGVGLGAESFRFFEFLAGLKLLWASLTYGHGGRGRVLMPRDLDFIVNDTDLRYRYGDRLDKLSRHIWDVQAASLKGWYAAQDNGF